MSDADRVFQAGNPDPHRFGISIRASCGDPPDQGAIQAVAAELGRKAFFVDQEGYECEIIAAAIHEPSGQIVYVETRAKEKGSYVDISIKIHLRQPDGSERSVDIESYNPFFGCDVRFIQWVDDVALIVYREKHRTYACAFGSEQDPKFVEAADSWMIKDRLLTFRGYEKKVVQGVRIPSLEPLDPMPLAEARSKGLAPPDPY